MNPRLYIALPLSIATALPVAAQVTAGPAVASQPAAEKKVCRRDDAAGSRIVTRTCLTAAEWAERDAKKADWADKAVTRGTGLSVQN